MRISYSTMALHSYIQPVLNETVFHPLQWNHEEKQIQLLSSIMGKHNIYSVNNTGFVDWSDYPNKVEEFRIQRPALHKKR